MGDLGSVEVKFIARQAKYIVPDTETIINRQTTCGELIVIVNKLLDKDCLPENFIKFEFLVLGDVLKCSLDKHLLAKKVQRDAKIAIEFYEKLPAPSVGELLLHDDWVAAIHAHTEDLILAGCYDGSVKLWNAEGKLLKAFSAHNHAIKAVTWLDVSNNEKKFVTGSDDGTCIIWSMSEKNQELGEIKLLELCSMPILKCKFKNCLQTNVQTVSACPSKAFFASGSLDGIINIWLSNQSTISTRQCNLESRGNKKRIVDSYQEKLPIQTFDGKNSHNAQVSHIEWTSNEKICSSSWDHSIKFWDIRTCQLESSIAGSKIFLDHSFSHLNGTIVTGSVDRHIRLFDPRVTTGSVVNCTFSSHTGWVSSVKWSPNDEYLFISGSYDSVAKLWDIRRPKGPLYDLKGHDDKILCCDWSVPTLMLTGGADNHLQIFKRLDKVQQ